MVRGPYTITLKNDERTCSSTLRFCRYANPDWSNEASPNENDNDYNNNGVTRGGGHFVADYNVGVPSDDDAAAVLMLCVKRYRNII